MARDFAVLSDADHAPQLQLRPVRVQEALQLRLGGHLDPRRRRRQLDQVVRRVLLQRRDEDVLFRLQKVTDDLPQQRRLAGAGAPAQDGPLARVQPEEVPGDVQRERVEVVHLRPVAGDHVGGGLLPGVVQYALGGVVHALARFCDVDLSGLAGARDQVRLRGGFFELCHSTVSLSISFSPR